MKSHPSPNQTAVTRRQLLQRLAGASLFASGALSPGLLASARLSLAQGEVKTAPGKRRPTLVVVFLRGGLDGLNLVAPYADEDYHRYRPGLAIARPGENRGALPIDDTFGLHPACASLLPAFASGHMVAMHAVGHPDNTRSHFEEQDRLELMQSEAPIGHPGWLARYLSGTPAQGPIRAISLGTNIPRSLRGPEPVLALASLEAMVNGAGAGAGSMEALEELYGDVPGSELQELLGTNGRATLDAMRRLSEVASQPFEAKGKYPETALGTRMREASRLIRFGLDLDVIQIDFTGFDTHQNQPQPFQNRVAQLSQSLAGMHADLAGHMDDVLVLAVSEFGRTARVNGTQGTDHGNGNCILAMGNALRNPDGKPRGVLGDWPTLAKDALRENRDLRVTTDIRNVYAEILTKGLGVEDTSKILPNWKAKPAGLLV